MFYIIIFFVRNKILKNGVEHFLNKNKTILIFVSILYYIIGIIEMRKQKSANDFSKKKR